MAEDIKFFASQAAVGLPTTQLYERRVHYHARSKSVLLSCRIRWGDFWRDEVFFRGASETAYRSLSDLVGEGIGRVGPVSLHTPIISASYLYCVGFATGTPQLTSKGRTAWPMEALGLIRVGLNNGSLGPVTQWVTSPWFASELVGCGDDDEVYAIVGEPSATRIGPVRYSLAVLCWDTQTRSTMQDLDSPFF